MQRSSALAVFTNHPLLCHITQFQRGIPLCIRALGTGRKCDFMLHIGDILKEIGFYWSIVMRCGDLDSVQLLCRMRQWPDLATDDKMAMADLPAFAAKCGRLDVIQWLHANDDIAPPPWSGILLRNATEHEELSRWLIVNRPDACVDNIADCMVAAARSGNIALLGDLVAFRPDAVTTELMHQALVTRQWEVIWILHNNSTVECPTKSMDVAAMHGFLDVVQFLHENRTEGCTTFAMDYAAYYGRLAMVQYLHENRTEGCTEKALMFAAQEEHLDVVRFLHEKRAMQAPPSLMEKLLKDGKFIIVQYLHEAMDVQFTDESVEYAKLSKNVELVQYVACRQEKQTTK